MARTIMMIAALLLSIEALMSEPAQAATIAGNVDSVRLNVDGTFSVLGWACAVGRAAAIPVDLYIGGPWSQGAMQGRTVASLSGEPAIALACKTTGSAHRFEFRLSQSVRASSVSKEIFIHAIDPDGGPNPLVAGSGSFTVPGGPIGNMEGVQLNSDGSFAVFGWACALGTSQPVSIDVYFENRWPEGAMKANSLANLPSEPAVALACKSSGTAHRFRVVFPSQLRSTSALQKIYIHARNPEPNANPLIQGSGKFQVPGGPYGQVDGTRSNADGSMSVYGWACAIGKSTSISVDLYLGAPWPKGVMKGRTTAKLSSEPAIAQACKSAGVAHRFSFTIAPEDRIRFATERVFVHGLNPEPGPNLLIGGSGLVRLPFDSSAIPPDEIRIANTGRYMFGTYVFPGWTRSSMTGGEMVEGWKVSQQWPSVFAASPLLPEADQPKRPLLNSGAYQGKFYDDSDPNAVDWMIKWGLESGVSLFVYDWYWTGAKDVTGALKPGLERPLEQGFLKSKYLAKYPNDIHFAILIANHYNWCYRPDCSTNQVVMREQVRIQNDAMIDYAIRNYFKIPQYLRIENKPAVMIWSFEDLKLGLTGEAGASELRETLRKWQLKAQDAGLGGLYLLSVMSTDQSLAGIGVQGTTAYSYAPHALQWASNEQSDLRGTRIVATGRQRWTTAAPKSLADLASNPVIGYSIPFDTYTEAYKRLWSFYYSEINKNYLPVVSPGWDDTPWKCRAVTRPELNTTAMSAACTNLLVVTHPGTRAAYKAGYKRQLLLGKDFLDTHSTLEATTSKGPRKLLLNEAWDEWGEGSVLAPSEKWGFSLLDSVHEVFGE